MTSFLFEFVLLKVMQRIIQFSMNNQQHNICLSYVGQKILLKTPQVHSHHPILLGEVTHIQKISAVIKRVGRQARHLVSSRELRSLQGLNDLQSQYYKGYQIVMAVILSLRALHHQGQGLIP